MEIRRAAIMADMDITQPQIDLTKPSEFFGFGDRRAEIMELLDEQHRREAEAVSITEAAALTGKSADQIRRAIRSKTNPLPAELFPTGYKINRTDLAKRFGLKADQPAASPEIPASRFEALEAENEALRVALVRAEAERDRAITVSENAQTTLAALREAIQALTISVAALQAPASDDRQQTPSERQQSPDPASAPSRSWWKARRGR
jgi:hypothetical protein